MEVGRLWIGAGRGGRGGWSLFFYFLISDFKLFLISEFYLLFRVFSNTGVANRVADHDPSAQNWPEDSGGLHIAGQTYNEGEG